MQHLHMPATRHSKHRKPRPPIHDNADGTTSGPMSRQCPTFINGVKLPSPQRTPWPLVQLVENTRPSVIHCGTRVRSMFDSWTASLFFFFFLLQSGRNSIVLVVWTRSPCVYSKRIFPGSCDDTRRGVVGPVLKRSSFRPEAAQC